MPIDRYKDIVIDDRGFRIHRVPADIGSFLSYRIATNPVGMSQEAFMEVQGYLLGSVQSLVVVDGQSNYVPVYIRQSKEWADKSLEFDLPLVTKLTMEALTYNFESFFADAKVKAMLSVLGLSSSNPSQP